MLQVAFAAVPLTAELGDIDAWILVALLAAPLAVPLTRTLATHRDGPALNQLLADTGRLLAVFSLLLSVGLLLS
jgi:1,4-dihydroxy-2-naphthoate octaprenyltransferase